MRPVLVAGVGAAAARRPSCVERAAAPAVTEPRNWRRLRGFTAGSVHGARDDGLVSWYQYTDAAMEGALASTEGGIGLLGSGRLDPELAIRALDIDDAEPSVEHLAGGEYPFSKDLSFATLGEPDPRSLDFIRFAMSPAGRAVMLEHGCLPLGGSGPAVSGSQ